MSWLDTGYDWFWGEAHEFEADQEIRDLVLIHAHLIYDLNDTFPDENISNVQQ